MFVFNASAQIEHPPVTMWEPNGLMEAFLHSKMPLQNLIFRSNYLRISNVFSYFLFNRNQQRKMFEFNVSARMGPPPVTMWESEGLMEAFLPLKKPLQNWLKPVNTVKQLFSVQLPEVQPQVSLGTKTELLSSRYLSNDDFLDDFWGNFCFRVLGRFSGGFLGRFSSNFIRQFLRRFLGGFWGGFWIDSSGNCWNNFWEIFCIKAYKKFGHFKASILFQLATI